MEKEYNCQIYFPLKAFAFGFPIILIVTALIILLGRFLHIQPVIGVTVVIILWLLPFMFQKKIKNLFTKHAFLKFNNKSFLVAISNLNDERCIREFEFEWNDIKSYRFTFTPSKYTVLDIYLIKEGSKKFIFNDNKTEDQSVKEESVFSIFHNFVKKCNEDRKIDEKIIFAQGFLITTPGLIILCCVGILVVFDIILHIIKYDINFAFLIMGIAIFLSLIAKRKQQKVFYERMSKLN